MKNFVFRDLDRESGPDRPVPAFLDLPQLETPRLILRKLKMKDAEDVFAYASDPEVARYVLWDPHRSLSDSRSYIRYIRHLYRQGIPSSWAVQLRKEGTVIVSIGYMWMSRENRSAEIGYSLSRPYWNHGLMTEALDRVLRFSFDDLHLNRIEAQYDLRNPASGRVMEKCGMKKEGLLRSRLWSKGRFIDVGLFAVLASDR